MQDVPENLSEMGEEEIQTPTTELGKSVESYRKDIARGAYPVHSLGTGHVQIGLCDKSRMTGDRHVRFRERLGVRFPRPTRLGGGCVLGMFDSLGSVK